MPIHAFIVDGLLDIKNINGEYSQGNVDIFSVDQYYPFEESSSGNEITIALLWDFSGHTDGLYNSLNYSETPFTKPFVRMAEMWQWAEYHDDGVYEPDRINSIGIECIVSSNGDFVEVSSTANNTFTGSFTFGNVSIISYDYFQE